tara:strand:- start:992 stop:1987 length:996 start_codon:yes stop_codon:yes gene_type:complete
MSYYPFDMALSDSTPSYLTSEFLKTVSFTRLRRGGYDIQEVDSFLAKFTELLDQQNLGHSDGVLDNSDLYDPEGAAQRLLAAAQRTADSLTQEAATQAEQLIASAEAQADNIRRVVVEEARKLAEESQEDLNKTLEDLNSQKEGLEEKCAFLEGQLNAGKDQLLAVLDEMRNIIEDNELSLPIIDGNRTGEATELATSIGPEFGVELVPSEEIPSIEFPADDELIEGLRGSNMQEITPELSLVHSKEDLESWIDAAAAGAEEGISNYWLEDEDEDDSGPPTQISPVVTDEASASGDRFFEELRDADPHESVLGLVDDETDAAITAFLSDED